MARNVHKKMTRVEVASSGGLARQALYGNLGTAEGRQKGGINSLVSHARMRTKFKTLKAITIPPHSEALAEFLGMLAGDGHVDAYQVIFTTNSKTDYQHAEYCALLAQKLFNVHGRIFSRPKTHTCVVTLNSRALCDYLVTQGLPCGSKIKLGITIPTWVKDNRDFAHAYVRGLFDSDGCVYQDKHNINGKQYIHIGMAFANSASTILAFFKSTLERAGLRPTQKTKFRVFLRRAVDIEKYFLVFGTSNDKHQKNINNFGSK